MGSTDPKRTGRLKRKKRIRMKLQGTAARPRLCTFRSSKHIYAQLIDDDKGHTMVAASSLEKSESERKEIGDKTAIARQIGKIVAERAIEKGIKNVVFDRNGFLYHGRIKAVSEGAREGGLKF